MRLMGETEIQLSNTNFEFIEYGSNEYFQAAQLRYRLFYQKHEIPFEKVIDDQKQQDLHLVIPNNLNQRILAYGRLAQNNLSEFQIYQMVVEPELQGQGLGTQILWALTGAAIQRGATLIVLNARVVKAEFYRKFGFEPVDEEFASSTTGVAHIRMQKRVVKTYDI